MPVLTATANPGTASWATTIGDVTEISTTDTTGVTASAAFTAKSGDSDDAISGAAIFQSGDALGTGDTGDVTIESGTVGDGGATTGDVNVTSGGSAVAATSGDVNITTGAVAGAGTPGDINITPGVNGGGSAGGNTHVAGIRTVAGITATAIAGATPLTLADSGGIFLVSEGGAPYSITLPVADGPGYRFTFMLTSIAGGNDVNIVTPGAQTFEGLIVNAITSVIAMAGGSQVNFATAAAIVGDHIEVTSVSATVWFVRAVCGVNGGITRTP